MNKASFHSADRPILIRKRNTIKKIVAVLFETERVELNHISYIFCSDKYLLKINQRHLNHFEYTDVISFCLSNSQAPVLGEIYISTDRIKENAKEFNQTYQTELLRVMIHGALHLCGYKDKSLYQKKKMRSKEDFYLQFYSTISFT
jgi:rRNA maturation RNase YbeY